jgi:hypothetical protein
VTEVLEQRWNDKLEALERLQGELDAHSDAAASLRLTKKEAILVWTMRIIRLHIFAPYGVFSSLQIRIFMEFLLSMALH